MNHLADHGEGIFINHQCTQHDFFYFNRLGLQMSEVVVYRHLALPPLPGVIGIVIIVVCHKWF